MVCQTIALGEHTVCFTTHALQRALELGITGKRITQIIAHPVDTVPSLKHNGITVTDGIYAVGLKPCTSGDHWYVATMLPRNRKQWERAARTGRLGAGRDFDPQRLPKCLRGTS